LLTPRFRLERNVSREKIETPYNGNNSISVVNTVINRKRGIYNLNIDMSKERPGPIVSLNSLLDGDITYERKEKREASLPPHRIV
jgi:hypothetical protein